MFNYLTFYTLMAGLEFVLSLVLVYYIFAVQRRNKILYLFLGSKLLDGFAMAGIALFYLGRPFPPFPFYIYVMLLGWILQSIAVVSYTERVPKYFIYYTTALVVVAGGIYAFSLDTDKWVAIITEILATILFASIALHLIAFRKNFKLPLFLGVAYLAFAFLNTVRVGSIFFVPDRDSFFINNLFDNIYFLTTMGLMVISAVGYLLLLSEVDKQRIFEEHRLNRVALEQSPLSIVMTNLSGIITYVNPTFCYVTGYTFEEAVGKNPKILKSGQTPTQVYESMWKTITSGNMWFGEFVNRNKCGEIYFEEAAISPLKNPDGSIDCYLALKNNITHRKMSEELILKQNKELKELDAIKTRLFSIIAHDLRNPIGNLMNLLEAAEESRAVGDIDETLQLISMAKNSSVISYSLLENLLSWANSQLNSVNLKPINANLNKLFDEIISLNQLSLDKKQIHLSISNPTNLEAFVDIETFKVVLRNIFTNAIKFTPHHGAIIISAERKDDRALIQIKDTGVGMSEKQLQSLFSFTENRTTLGTAGEKGTGLGLVLSHEFIMKNSGQLWVESEQNKGTTFFLSVPIAVI